MLEAATHWRLVHEILHKDIQTLDHSLLVRYEDLCQNLIEYLGQIQEFLDLDQPFDPGIQESVFRAHNIDGAPRPIRDLNSKSIARLSAHDLEIITRETAETMQKFGYKPI